MVTLQGVWDGHPINGNRLGLWKWWLRGDEHCYELWHQTGGALCHQLELLCFDYSYHLIAVLLGALVSPFQLCI